MAIAGGCVFFCEVLEDIAQTHAVACHFVGVGRADAFACGADFSGAFGSFVGCVEQAVCGQDKMSFLRELEGALEVDAALAEGLGFLHEKHGVKHHTVAYKIGFLVLEHARGYGAEHIFLAVEFKGVAGVGPTLKTGYHIVTRSEHIHYFTFSFVAPLEAEQNINFHFL